MYNVWNLSSTLYSVGTEQIIIKKLEVISQCFHITRWPEFLLYLYRLMKSCYTSTNILLLLAIISCSNFFLFSLPMKLFYLAKFDFSLLNFLLFIVFLGGWRIGHYVLTESFLSIWKGLLSFFGIFFSLSEYGS